VRRLVVVFVVGLGACAAPSPSTSVADAPSPSPSPTLTELPAITLELPGFSDQRVRRIRGFDEGEEIAKLTVPDLGIQAYPIRFGITLDTLALGPGVYPGSAPPGHGNFSMAGHRITPVGPWDHGPFRYVNELQQGAVARVKWKGETYTYRFVRTIIVAPSDTTVLRDKRADMTWTACHPPGSAAERIVAQWELVSVP
jgi:LPXTG-site transpeptidase (sortase) family protein